MLESVSSGHTEWIPSLNCSITISPHTGMCITHSSLSRRFVIPYLCLVLTPLAGVCITPLVSLYYPLDDDVLLPLARHAFHRVTSRIRRPDSPRPGPMVYRMGPAGGTRLRVRAGCDSGAELCTAGYRLVVLVLLPRVQCCIQIIHHGKSMTPAAMVGVLGLDRTTHYS
jgi:hypothetical protein